MFGCGGVSVLFKQVWNGKFGGYWAGRIFLECSSDICKRVRICNLVSITCGAGVERICILDAEFYFRWEVGVNIRVADMLASLLRKVTIMMRVQLPGWLLGSIKGGLRFCAVSFRAYYMLD